MASVRSYQKPHPCLTEPIPDSSRMDPLLAKGKPLKDGSNRSDNILKQEEKLLQRMNCG